MDMAARMTLSTATCSRWSLNNRLLAMIAGTSDARGYRQWQEVGRFVKGGTKALYIVAPKKFKKGEVEDAETGEKHAVFGISGFLAVPLFRFEDTDGKP